MMTLTPQEYVEAFFSGGCADSAAGGDCQPAGARKTMALQAALDNYRYEKEMYWRKSVFFWTFIGISFSGLLVANATMQNPTFSQFILCCIGAVISFAWIAITQGSKYNQQKWCRIVHTLEDEAFGPIFKTHTMVRRTDARVNRLYDPAKGVVTDPASSSYELRPFCVSRINDYLSYYMAWTWVFLAVRYFVKTAPELVSFFMPVFSDPAVEQSFVSFSFMAFSAYFLVMMFIRCRTNPNEVNCSDESFFQVAKFSR